MKYCLDPVVKEQMQFSPTLPMKSNGNTAQKKEWIEQVQKSSTKSDIGFQNRRQDKYALEMMDETGAMSQSPDEAYILKNDIGIDMDFEHSTLNVVSNNPQRDPENDFRDYMGVNYKYDKSVSRVACKDGYIYEALDGLTNEYTDQHRTIFYDSVTREDKETGKSVTGFLERGNFLDRI